MHNMITATFHFWMQNKYLKLDEQKCPFMDDPIISKIWMNENIKLWTMYSLFLLSMRFYYKNAWMILSKLYISLIIQTVMFFNGPFLEQELTLPPLSQLASTSASMACI